MRKLTQAVETSISKQILPVDFKLMINDKDYSSYLQDWTISFSKDFGASIATLVLNNEDGRFSDGGTEELKPGNMVSFTEIFKDMQFEKFYGELKNRSIVKINYKQITLVCYDFIATLQNLDIDIFMEGNKKEIKGEILEAIYLDEPNESLAQIFNFSNNSIATLPTPSIEFQDVNSLDSSDSQSDGYELLFSEGQLFLGTPLNVLDNYLVKSDYSYYVNGIPVEDAIEAIITQVTGYGDYLFGETTQQDLIDKHLTASYSEMQGTDPERLLVSYTSQTIDIEHELTEEWSTATQISDGNLYISNPDGFPSPETSEDILANIGDNFFTYNYIGSHPKFGAYLSGIPTTGEFSLGDIYAGVKVEQGEKPSLNRKLIKSWRPLPPYNDVNLYLEYIDLFPIPTTGEEIECNIDDDVFTYSYIGYDVTYGYYLSGIPTSGEFSLSTKLILEPAGEDLWVETPQIVQYGIAVANETYTTQDYLLNNVTTDGNLYLDSTEGLPIPASGETVECSISGDVFTYNYIGYDTTYGPYLSGIPTDGEFSLRDKQSGNYMSFGAEYEAGQVFYHAFNNHITNLDISDFTLPTGVEIKYIDKKMGRIMLTEPTLLSANILCNSDYSFKTIQSTGISVNQINFRSRDTSDRLVAINQLKEYLAPNYLLRTIGDKKIWGSYVRQKTVADWDLQLVRNVNYMEDADLYTRVKFYRKNKQPTNIMFGDDIDYTSDDEDSYTGISVQDELFYIGEEKSGLLSSEASLELSEANILNLDNTAKIITNIQEIAINKDYPNQASTGYHIYSTPISGDAGKIILGSVVPTVYINGVPVDNKSHSMTGVACKVSQDTKTQTVQEISDGKGKATSVRSYYYYTVIFAHTSVDPSSAIYLYNNQGILEYTLEPNDENMNYNTGIWTIPGTERNDVAEILSTASYKVLFADDALEIDYANALFKINSKILPSPTETYVRATFEYWAISINVKDIELVVDGRRDTQLQVEFYGEPPSGFHLATIDLGSVQRVQAIDLISGFYKPDEFRKFDVNFALKMEYSTNGVDFYSISDITESISFSGGQAISLEEDALGSDFNAQYLRFSVIGVDKIDYGRGRYVVAITEIAVYNNVIIESDAKLIPTTYTTDELEIGENVLHIENTKFFDSPEVGEYATAYLNASEFIYTEKSETELLGCVFQTGTIAYEGSLVTTSLENSTDIYDYDGLVQGLGERVYKDTKFSDGSLFTQADLDWLAKSWLYEFVKEHTKLNTEVLYVPFLNVGDTVSITDEYNNLYQERYFIENLQDRKGFYTLTMGKYPE